MTNKAMLTMVDDVNVVVPDSLNLITSYVLREQGDWFEDEIKFLRHLLSSGQKIIDIGANYGVYTLPMAQLVGVDGKVWSFEPASTTSRFLAESVNENNFSQVELIRKALSNKSGEALLSLNANSELNELVRDGETHGETEVVSVTTLDECLGAYAWQDIDFLKLDAEGEERNILQGGVRFFSKESPLIQYEVKAGKKLHLGLIQSFADLGYDSYRLVPGLNILVPFSANEQADGFLLNLFGCKPDRANHLASEGLLVDKNAKSCVDTKEYCSNQSENWIEKLTELPYGRLCNTQWRQAIANGRCSQIEVALSSYLMSQDESLNVTKRYIALEDSFNRLESLSVMQPGILQLSSLSRVARDYGARAVSAKALGELCNGIFQRKQMIDFTEPFLAPSKRFDSVAPRNSIINWIAGAALEELERNGSFSSYYSGSSSRQRLTAIRNLGYGSDEMSRRLHLIEQRFDAS